MSEISGQPSATSAAWRAAESKLWLARVAPEVLESADAGEIDLSTGSPPFPVAARVKEAIQAKVREIDHLEYPPTTGDPALHETIAEFDQRHLEAPYGADRIVVTYGAMQALSDVIGTVAARGDEVLLPTPYWFQFPHIVALNGAVPKDIRTYPGNRFKLTPKLLAEAITPRSRLLILTSPGNPTGIAYSHDELKELMDVVSLAPNLTVASDEVYNLLFPGASPLRAAPSVCSMAETKDRVVVINSLSKNFAMSGLRVGYAATTNEPLFEAMSQRQRFTSLGVNRYLQAGARAALEAAEEIVGGINRALVPRREAARKLLDTVPRIQYLVPEAGYYFWVDVSGWLGCRYKDPTGGEKVIRDDKDLSTYLRLEIRGERRVAVVNGTDCGMPGYVRITYAVLEDTFAEGIRRIRQRLDALRCG